jgi:hypothetical protein
MLPDELEIPFPGTKQHKILYPLLGKNILLFGYQSAYLLKGGYPFIDSHGGSIIQRYKGSFLQTLNIVFGWALGKKAGIIRYKGALQFEHKVLLVALFIKGIDTENTIGVKAYESTSLIGPKQPFALPAINELEPAINKIPLLFGEGREGIKILFQVVGRDHSGILDRANVSNRSADGW